MRDYKLTASELEQVQWGMHHAPEAEVRQRATALHLLHLGKKPQEVSHLLAVSLKTVYNWHQRWRSAGLEGLANKPKSGRPQNADANYCRQLEEALEQSPSAYGYGFGMWTVDRLREHLYQETGISLSNRRLRALLKKLGFVYRRPKHDLTPLQDAEAKTQATALLDWLKKDVLPTTSSYCLWMKQV